MARVRMLAALACGVMFGFGLALSGMVDPARCGRILDIGGQWNPSLAFVLGVRCWLPQSGIGWHCASADRRLIRCCSYPQRTRIDRQLVAGAAIFGIGWGIAGYCPGPAIASLSMGLPSVVVFVIAMGVGMVVHDQILPCLVAKRP